jgi:hypothetical protein
MANNNTSAVISLRQIVMSLKSRSKELNMMDYEMLMQLAIEAYTNLNIYHMSTYEVAYIPLEGKEVVNLPSDFIDYTKIAINLCGRYYTLTLNNDLIPPKGVLCGEPIEHVAAGCYNNGILPLPNSGFGFIPHYRGDTFIPTFYAMGGGFSGAGQYKIDRANRQIILSGVPKTELVVEYRSSGVKKNGKTFVPIQCREPIIDWMRWQLSEYGHINANPERMKQNYYESEALMKALDFSRTYEEYMDIMYESWQQGIKR